MSTQPNPPVGGLSIQAVVKATGLSRSTIYQAAEAARLGSPAHFRYIGNAIVYTFAGLCQLVQGLEELRQDDGAKLLRSLLGMARQQTATADGVTRPTEPAVESWLERWERRQEEAAA